MIDYIDSIIARFKKETGLEKMDFDVLEKGNEAADKSLDEILRDFNNIST